MTAAGPELSAPLAGAGESMSLDFSDPERGLFGIVRLARVPAAGLVEACWAVLENGKPAVTGALEGSGAARPLDGVEIDGLRTAAEGADRFSLALSVPELDLDVEATVAAHAGTAANEGGSPSRAAGLAREELLCEVEGRLELRGNQHSLRCPGRWMRSSGAPRWDEIDRWRSLYAAAEDGPSMLVAAARQRGGDGHEICDASLLGLKETPISFEDVRLSTVWDEDGLPATASVELFAPGEEIPRRFGGEALGGAKLGVRDGSLSVSFLRWSVEGVPAYGCYETLLPG